MLPKFGRKWGTECLNTRFPLPTLQCAGYNVKLIFYYYILKNTKKTIFFKSIKKITFISECLIEFYIFNLSSTSVSSLLDQRYQCRKMLYKNIVYIVMYFGGFFLNINFAIFCKDNSLFILQSKLWIYFVHRKLIRLFCFKHLLHSLPIIKIDKDYRIKNKYFYKY